MFSSLATSACCGHIVWFNGLVLGARGIEHGNLLPDRSAFMFFALSVPHWTFILLLLLLLLLLLTKKINI